MIQTQEQFDARLAEIARTAPSYREIDRLATEAARAFAAAQERPAA